MALVRGDGIALLSLPRVHISFHLHDLMSVYSDQRIDDCRYVPGQSEDPDGF